jgi:hypothetical protein
MTATQVDEATSAATNATNATVEIEALSENKLSVAVFWPETQGEDGDHCHGQQTIRTEAYNVLAALEEQGWSHCEFGGRRDMGHSGGRTHFAVCRAV